MMYILAHIPYILDPPLPVSISKGGGSKMVDKNLVKVI